MTTRRTRKPTATILVPSLGRYFDPDAAAIVDAVSTFLQRAGELDTATGEPEAATEADTPAARIAALVRAGVHREAALQREADPPRLREALAVARVATAEPT